MDAMRKYIFFSLLLLKYSNAHTKCVRAYFYILHHNSQCTISVAHSLTSWLYVPVDVDGWLLRMNFIPAVRVCVRKRDKHAHTHKLQHPDKHRRSESHFHIQLQNTHSHIGLCFFFCFFNEAHLRCNVTKIFEMEEKNIKLYSSNNIHHVWPFMPLFSSK